MYRYQILIEYVGTHFVGWQIQSKGRSIQKLIQSKLSRILKEKIQLVGSGRTDSGVHAHAQSAHFVSNKKIIKKVDFLNTLNFFLNKKKISILKNKLKKNNFHDRFSAKKRVYKYVIINRIASLALDLNKAWHIKQPLNTSLMNKAAKLLEGTRDFSTYRSSSCGAKSPIRTLEKVKINVTKKENKITILFQSQSFLQQQVRSMVGCLKFVADGKWSLKKFKFIMDSKKRINCAPPAPAKGLYLSKVSY